MKVWFYCERTYFGDFVVIFKIVKQELGVWVVAYMYVTQFLLS